MLPNHVSWIKFLIAGVFLTGVMMFPVIAMYNIVVCNIPLRVPDQQTSSEPLYATIPSLHFFNKVSPEDPAWKNIITEDQVWEHAWAFYQNKDGMTIFLPVEKRSLGLHQVIDEHNNRFLAWEFDVMQNNYRFISGGCNHGGTVIIDAYTGNILFFIDVC